MSLSELVPVLPPFSEAAVVGLANGGVLNLFTGTAFAVGLQPGKYISRGEKAQKRKDKVNGKIEFVHGTLRLVFIVFIIVGATI
jgi:hypothetical protein